MRISVQIAGLRIHCCDDADLMKGTAIRKKNATAFTAEEKESKRTVAILKKETV